MSSLACVAIHSSQFPGQVRRDLLESLRSRRVNHKFHYDSVKQTTKWLALHEAFSPARQDPDCLAIYDRAFIETARRIDARSIQVIGLGCGGGQKDTRLLQLLRRAVKTLAYTPCDVSAAMVLTASNLARSVLADKDCRPLVCDLAAADDLPNIFESIAEPDAARLITFFGMIPNFEQRLILRRLASLLRPSDYLLFSANLAPGPDYAAGVRRVLPLYDNALTRDWLMTFLLDLGVESSDGQIQFAIEDDDASELKRITAAFHFTKPRRIAVDGETFDFRPGENIRLFFSYRHRPDKVRALLAKNEITVLEQWIAKSEEEGVFLCRRNKTN